MKNDNEERSEEGNLLLVLLRRPLLLGFAIVSIITSFVYSQFSFSAPLQATDLFGDNGPKTYGMLMTTNALTVIFMTVFLTHVTRRIKPILNIAIACLLYAIGFGIIFYINSIALLLISTVIWTLGEILQHTNSGVYIANHTPMSHRGRFNSVIPIIMGAGQGISPLIMGEYIENNGVRLVWPIIFLLSIGASILMLVLYFLENRSKSKAKTVE